MRILHKKFVISHIETEYTKPATILIVYENDKDVEMSIIYDDEECDINNIYVAHVNDVVKNIDGAFLEYQKGKIGYLSLKEAVNPVFINNKNTTKVCQGDNVLVQLIKEPVKTKNGVLTTNVQFSGKYVVFEAGTNCGVRISKKISDKAFEKQVIEKLQPLCEDCSFIVRTEAYTADIEAIINEAIYFKAKYNSLKEIALHRPAYTLIYKALDSNISLILDIINNGDEIISDNNDLLEQYKSIISTYNYDVDYRLYEDKLLPLYKLYNFEGVLKEIASKNIWLKSGAYLVIEYTEAMTVIDVNTGKCIKGSNSDKTFYNINIEAGKEILRQIRLRNISGIIMCDFINMENEEHNGELMKTLRELAKNDRLKVNVVDMTRLKITEITRKKIRERIILKKLTGK